MQLSYTEPATECLRQQEWWESMAWGARVHSKGQIDRAGRELAVMSQQEEPSDIDAWLAWTRKREEYIKILDNWRACHAYPLQVIKMTLLHRARKIDPNSLIAQRLKRRPSIELKLHDNPKMKLSQMQDIGGCRAVLSNVSQVKKLVSKYKQFHAKSPQNRSDWDGSDDFDYIARPKPDGYRSVHLVFRFQSLSPERCIYNGQRIEIQIRSKLQHLWATAVETAQVFTGQALKSKVKNASDDWLRFFALTSSAFALREKSPTVPGTPDKIADIVSELKLIVGRTNIMANLKDWNDTVHVLEGADPGGARFYLLILDSTGRTLKIERFRQDEAVGAQKAYDKAEKENESKPNVQVVLVSVDDLAALPKAYPNYYVDTKAFIDAIEREID